MSVVEAPMPEYELDEQTPSRPRVPMLHGRPVSSMWRPAVDVAMEAVEEIDLMNQHPDALALRTGIKAFDDVAGPALEPGRLIVVAGQSGGAKTALLAQWAVAFAAQRPTLLVTLEDDERDLVKRALANVSRENVGLIRRGFPGQEIPGSVLDAAGALAGLQLDLSDDVGSPTVEELAIMMMAWRRTHSDAPHCVVLVDQLSHIRPSDPDDAFWQRFPQYPKPPGRNAPTTKVLEWQVNMLREAARKHGLTVVLAHQLNDNVSGTEKPRRQSIRDSRGIVHKADLVVAPWVPDQVPNEWAGPGEPKLIPNDRKAGYLIGIKARTVAEFEAPVRFVGAQQRFVDVADDEAEAWRSVPAPSVSQLEGARKLTELRGRFALAALQRQAAAGRELPSAG